MPAEIAGITTPDLPPDTLYMILGIVAFTMILVFFVQAYCLKVAVAFCGGGERTLLHAGIATIAMTVFAGVAQSAIKLSDSEPSPMESTLLSTTAIVFTCALVFGINPIRAFAVCLTQAVLALFASALLMVGIVLCSASLLPSDFNDDIAKKFMARTRTEYDSNSIQGMGSESSEWAATMPGEFKPDDGVGEVTVLGERLGRGAESTVLQQVKSSKQSEKKETIFKETADLFFSEKTQEFIQKARGDSLPAVPTYEAEIRANPFVEKN